jgi:hypothetical protein
MCPKSKVNLHLQPISMLLLGQIMPWESLPEVCVPSVTNCIQVGLIAVGMQIAFVSLLRWQESCDLLVVVGLLVTERVIATLWKQNTLRLKV